MSCAIFPRCPRAAMSFGRVLPNRNEPETALCAADSIGSQPPQCHCGHLYSSVNLVSQIFGSSDRLSPKSSASICSPVNHAGRPADHSRHTMPIALFALTIAAYAIGTTEFVIVGLLPTVAADLHISLPLAGLIVSVYALGVTFGAPVADGADRTHRKEATASRPNGALRHRQRHGGDQPELRAIASRACLSGFAHGVFFSVGSTIAADLVPENRRASAIAMMFMGLTVAIVTGVPLGTLIGQIFGWRATFCRRCRPRRRSPSRQLPYFCRQA